jgi:uncharacterized membrane protein
MADDTKVLSATARENIELLAEHDQREGANVSGVQAVIERISGLMGSSSYFVLVVVFILGWVGVNLHGMSAGWRYVDPPPFNWLQGIVSSNALLLTVAVLIRQKRMAQLADRRAHLDLHVNLLTERKVSKILQIVDELRRDLPARRRGHDEETAELALPADTEALLHAIKEHHTEA